KSDDRDDGLLRLRYQWPADRRATEKRDELASLHGRHVGSVKKKAREIGLILSKNVKSGRNR
ncbi:MAG: hypothetical protein WBF73_17380, partial [Bradyrhizobium sp.]